MSLNLEHTTSQPTEHFKIDTPDHPSDLAVLASYCYDDSTNEGNGERSVELEHSEEEEIEFTDRELDTVERTAETLTRERSQKRDHERELLQIRNNLQKVMESDFPFQMKIKLMESINELLATKVNCMSENNRDVKEKVLNAERINNYMTPLAILSDWKRTGKLTTELPEQMSTNPTNNMLFTEVVTEEAQDEQEYVEQLRNEVQTLEGVVVLLKQATIPLTISYENLKEEFDEMQDIVKAKKRSLEEKLREVESIKHKIARRDSYKENINPQTERGKNDKKVKLRDIYMDYEEKSQDLNSSRLNSSVVNNTNNKTVLQEASSKFSKMFGSMFKSKKEKASENILTTEVLKDLGIGSVTKR